jgi:hypothetical protein
VPISLWEEQNCREEFELSTIRIDATHCHDSSAVNPHDPKRLARLGRRTCSDYIGTDRTRKCLVLGRHLLVPDFHALETKCVVISIITVFGFFTFVLLYDPSPGPTPVVAPLGSRRLHLRLVLHHGKLVAP